MFPPLRLKEALGLGGLSPRELAARTWRKINDNEILTRAAAVAFYAMSATVPFLALILTLVIQFLPDPTGTNGQAKGLGNMTVQELQDTVRSLFPAEAYGVVEDQIKRIQDQPPVGLLSIGLAVTIWLSSSLFLAIIDALNRIHRVTETRSLVKLRLVAIAMTFIQAIILIGSLLAIVAYNLIARRLGLGETAAAFGEVVLLLSVFGMVLVSFALTFYVGPDAQQRWEWITPGSLFGTGVFLAFTYLFRFYVQHYANYNKTYGSLGGVMVLMFWYWVSSVVLLTAGQINMLIEDASPLGKREGQKADPTQPPDFAHMPAEPQSLGRGDEA